MARLILPVAFALSMTACANHKTRAVQLVVASDAIADEVATAWDVGLKAQVDHCRATLEEPATKEQRDDCLGIFGKGKELDDAVQSLVNVQILIREAVKCEELKSCPQKVDWKELKAAALSTWSILSPFYNTIVKKGK